MIGRRREGLAQLPQVNPLEVMGPGLVEGVVQVEPIDESTNAHTVPPNEKSPWTVAHGHRRVWPDGMKRI